MCDSQWPSEDFHKLLDFSPSTAILAKAKFSKRKFFLRHPMLKRPIIYAIFSKSWEFQDIKFDSNIDHQIHQTQQNHQFNQIHQVNQIHHFHMESPDSQDSQVSLYSQDSLV